MFYCNGLNNDTNILKTTKNMIIFIYESNDVC